VAGLCGLLILAGCDKSAPAGVGAGNSATNEATESGSVERVKTQTASNTGAAKEEVSAGVLIFSELAKDLPLNIDQALARMGAKAFSGSDTDQLGQVMALASRPVLAWPVNPMDDEKKARRWAATMAACVSIADKVGASIAGGLPARALADEDKAREYIRTAFEGLDHGALMADLRRRAGEPVTLDLADSSGVRFASTSGLVALDAEGAKLTKAGAASCLRWTFVHGGS
jgi:hypothetical protein